MCDAAAAVAIISAVYGAASARSAAKAEERQYEYQAKVQESQAKSVVEQGAQEVLALKRQAAKLQGRQTAIAAASGMTASGSMEDVHWDTSKAVLDDELAIRYNTELQAWATRTGAASNKQAAAQARQAGKINAMTSLLGGATGVARNYNAWKTVNG